MKKTVEKELYISKSEKFVKLHECLKKSSLEKVVERYVDIYDERRQNCFTSGVFTFTFYSDCGLANDNIVDSILPELVEFGSVTLSDDLRVLLNFYAHATLLCGLSSTSNKDSDEETVTNVHNNAMIDDNETDKALYCISSGTLCEIIKVHKRRISNKHLSDKQRARAKVVLQTASGFAMTSEEKKSLPLELQQRDRGNMVFPNAIFMPYIRAVNLATKSYLNEAALKKYGIHLLQV